MKVESVHVKSSAKTRRHRSRQKKASKVQRLALACGCCIGLFAAVFIGYRYYTGPVQVARETDAADFSDYDLSIVEDSLGDLANQPTILARSGQQSPKRGFLAHSLLQAADGAVNMMEMAPNIDGSAVYVKGHALALDLKAEAEVLKSLIASNGSSGIDDRAKILMLKVQISDLRKKIKEYRQLALRVGP